MSLSALKTYTRLVVLLLILLVTTLLPTQVNASSNLEDAKDVISNNQIGALNVQHLVEFRLPSTADLVSSSDYIQITLTNFTNINIAAAQVSGSYFGTPTFSLDDKTIKVTGIAILPGRTVQILGFSANNPPLQTLYGVQLSITEDEAGTIIKNFAQFNANSGYDSVSVSATVLTPQSTVTFSGNTAPGTTVSITENGTVIGSDIAGGSLGFFQKYISAISPTTHNFSIYGVDRANFVTTPINISIYTPVFQNTIIDDLLLSPTMGINKQTISQGEDLIATGSAIPGGAISLFTESPLRTYSASVGATGLWNYTITNTIDYIPGDYRIYSLVQDSSANQSLFSPGLQFTVAATSSGTPAGCDISQGDLTCDSNINLNDFSVLMYYWGSTNAAADINSDNTVNLVDFSIMMYYWGT